ncbi:magnesium chelatase subunit H [Methyloversatilis thermotolerans]|uniref:magnesium chelatase subunit H n=1 Tax=Methyloversatilis thermotolerans TaxID=1346290 RepID=UPI0004758657|nr:magnesium chelatase subunit H [Methyloversatilis thermotolerans]
MPKLTSRAEAEVLHTPVRVAIITMDTHLASATERARSQLRRTLASLQLEVYAAAEWIARPEALARCEQAIATADVLIVSMLFMEEHYRPVLPALTARRNACDAIVCIMSAPEVTRLSRLGRFDMQAQPSGALALLKRLRGQTGKDRPASSGERQMRMLRRLPKLLRFIPGTAQDVRAYFLTLQYWLAGSQDNVANMVRMLIDRYADGPRAALRGKVPAAAPVEYPDVGLYHPDLPARITEAQASLPAAQSGGTVGVLLMRSYLLAGNAGHYDGVIRALEARGMRTIPAFATGLDARPAVERFFIRDGRPTVDAVVSLTGFSLVGGPAYNDAHAAEALLTRLDVPYIAAHPVEFQTLEQWGASGRGLMPVENTIMVAIPELDGATQPMVFGGRSDGQGGRCEGCARCCSFPPSEGGRDMHVCAERAEQLAARVDALVALRRTERANKRVAIVLFNFPPNGGAVGTAAHLSVFSSLYRTLTALSREGYAVDLPADEQALRDRLLHGNAERFGTPANVACRIPAEEHIRREPWLADIEAHWGPAPGRHLSDGRHLFVLGEHFGNVFVGLQPPFGYEGDPMRLLFEQGFAPTHAFACFYRWLRDDYAAHAVLHFGTHGALEFMPGKQAGLSGRCWPERLIGALPNIYLYASNNPSEGALAKRRSGATLISYMTPPITEAGLYAGLADLKSSIERWRRHAPDDEPEALLALIRSQAEALELECADDMHGETYVQGLCTAVSELEHTLIPCGLHVVGEVPTPVERADLLRAVARARYALELNDATVDALLAGQPADAVAAAGGPATATPAPGALDELIVTARLLAQEHEIDALLRALDGRFTRPAPGGDLLRTPDVLPTGRNLHGFDPFRIPSAYAVMDGARQAARLLARHVDDGHAFPESIAMVLWGTDNLKTEGGPIAQAMALMGAAPRFDSYGRLAGARLEPLDTLGRPRVDVVITLSGIFRDLMPLQIRMLAEAAHLAACADEDPALNFVRKHALAYQASHGCDLETAALRVFGNAEGAYGANVNHLIENSCWDEEDELAETYTRRKGHAYGRDGLPVAHTGLLSSMLADVELTYQNLESVELGVTTVDTYVDTLGGISRAVRRARGADAPVAPVYIGDQTTGGGTVRTLDEQVALETRTRMLNPKWYEGMLAHGYEGVRQIEAHITHTLGWSATTGQVSPWIYQQLTQTFMLDEGMRSRLAELNPTSAARVAQRLLEAHDRRYWQPDEGVLSRLMEAGNELEDRLEGVFPQQARA